MQKDEKINDENDLENPSSKNCFERCTALLEPGKIAEAAKQQAQHCQEEHEPGEERRRRFMAKKTASQEDTFGSIDLSHYFESQLGSCRGVEPDSTRDDPISSSSSRSRKIMARRDTHAESFLLLNRGMNTEVRVVPSQYSGHTPLFTNNGERARRCSTGCVVEALSGLKDAAGVQVEGVASPAKKSGGTLPKKGEGSKRRLSAPDIVGSPRSQKEPRLPWAPSAFVAALESPKAATGETATAQQEQSSLRFGERERRRVHPAPLNCAADEDAGRKKQRREQASRSDHQTAAGGANDSSSTREQCPTAEAKSDTQGEKRKAVEWASSVPTAGKSGKRSGSSAKRHSIFTTDVELVDLLKSDEEMMSCATAEKGLKVTIPPTATGLLGSVSKGVEGYTPARKDKQEGYLDPFTAAAPETSRHERRSSLLFLTESLASVDRAVMPFRRHREGSISEGVLQRLRKRKEQVQLALASKRKRMCAKGKPFWLCVSEQFLDALRSFVCGVLFLSLSLAAFWGIMHAIAPQALLQAQQEGATTGVIMGTVISLAVAFAAIFTVVNAYLAWTVSKPLRDLQEDLDQLCSLQFMDEGGWTTFKTTRRNTSCLPVAEVIKAQASFNVLQKALLAFAKYVPADVVQSLVRARGDAVLAVTPRKVTIFFSDIAGFTTYAESLPQEELVKWLASYFSVMCDVVDKRKGVVGEFIGDAIMAYWNGIDGIDVDEHEYLACDATLRQLELLVKLRELWEERGWPKCRIRCGLHTDIVLCGNIGSPKRLKYGLVGDGVNLASRLEGLCKRYKVSSIISESVAQGKEVSSSFLLRPLDRVIVKGKGQPVTIYELVGRKKGGHTTKEKRCAAYGHIVRNFWKGEWSKCCSSCRLFLKYEPNDRPCQLLLERAQHFLSKEEAEEALEAAEATSRDAFRNMADARVRIRQEKAARKREEFERQGYVEESIVCLDEK